MATLTHLDTHVVVWIAAGLHDRLSQPALDAIEHDTLRVSPMVALELGYLQETGRSELDPEPTLAELRRSLGLREGDEAFTDIVAAAHDLDWTRDPFDRLIAAQSLVAGARLLTKDETIRANLPTAVW